MVNIALRPTESNVRQHSNTFTDQRSTEDILAYPEEIRKRLRSTVEISHLPTTLAQLKARANKKQQEQSYPSFRNLQPRAARASHLLDNLDSQPLLIG